MATKYCEKCGRTLKDIDFYQYKDGSKTELCKKCLTMHINNFDPSTFLWLLEKMDVPYIPQEWNSLRDKAYEKNPDTMNGMSVFGKYLSKMRLNQWKEYGWKDSEDLQKEAEEKKAAFEKEREERIAIAKEKFEKGEISEAEYKTLTDTPTQIEEEKKRGRPRKKAASAADNEAPLPNFYSAEDYIDPEELPNPADELTKEDKIYLAMKWGVYYRPNELIELERNYNEMIESFDIQDADTINSLKLICKTNLKMNQCVDSADIDGQQKLARVYDSLRKTAKFTAAQNKEEKGDFVDSIGNMVVLCEKEGGFIPRFATDTPQDKVDLVLKDNQDYLKKLVTQDLGFGQQIEDAIKKIQIQQEMNEKAEREEKMREQLKDADYVEQLKDENYREFYEMAEEQKAADEAFIEEDTQNELKTEQRIKVIKKKKGE